MKTFKEFLNEEIANSTSGIATPSLPIKFGNNYVFDVEDDIFRRATLGKPKYKTFKKHLGESDKVEKIKTFSNKNPNKKVILRNKNTGAMVFLKRDGLFESIENLEENIKDEMSGEEIAISNATKQAKITGVSWIVYKTPHGSFNATKKSVWDSTSEKTRSKNKIIKTINPDKKTNNIEQKTKHDPIKVISNRFKKIEYEEDKDGNRIRKWGDGNSDYVTDHDVKTWLSGNRVIENLKSGLEYVKPEYIDRMIKDDYLRKDSKGYYWITKKAADKFGLKKVMNKDFPK